MNTVRLCWRPALRATSRQSPSAPRINPLAALRPRWFSYAQIPGSFQVPSITEDDGPLIENGIPNLYTPVGFQFSWTDYQSYALTELNSRLEDGTFALGNSEPN
jgi:hypothetical protein